MTKPCEHAEAARSLIYDQDGCKVEKCRACGFSIEDGKVSKYRTCPFCDDWFIDPIDDAETEVGCQGCGATAPAEVWNNRARQDAAR